VTLEYYLLIGRYYNKIGMLNTDHNWLGKVRIRHLYAQQQPDLLRYSFPSDPRPTGWPGTSVMLCLGRRLGTWAGPAWHE
jgi:hypothetical protein